MAGAAAGAAAVGGIVSSAGALLKGQTTANSLNAQAQIQEQQAAESKQAAQYNVFRSQLNASMAQGRASAAYGAAGVSSSSESAQAVLMAGAQNAELDRQNILHEADYRAINYENQASLDRIGADSSLEGSYFSAMGSALGGSTALLGNMTGRVTPQNLNPNETTILQNNVNQLGQMSGAPSPSPENINTIN